MACCEGEALCAKLAVPLAGPRSVPLSSGPYGPYAVSGYTEGSWVVLVHGRSALSIERLPFSSGWRICVKALLSSKYQCVGFSGHLQREKTINPLELSEQLSCFDRLV